MIEGWRRRGGWRPRCSFLPDHTTRDMKPTHPLSILAVAAVAIFASRLPAQVAAVQTAPYSCADTTSRALGFLPGEYSARAAFRAGPTAWDSTTATVTITRDLDGCVLREHFRGTRYGAPYEYLALWSANGGATMPIQRFFVHSQHGILVLSAGRRTGDTLVVGDSVILRGRWVFQEVALWPEGTAATVLRSESRRSEDGRATWFITQRMRYQRRATRP
jgi:hypothetical protein